MAVMAIHPGEHLAAALKALEMSAAELARKISVPTNRVTQILNGTRSVTGDTALRLGHFFGTSPQFWLNLQTLYDVRIAEQKAGKAIRAPKAEAQRARARLNVPTADPLPFSEKHRIFNRSSLMKRERLQRITIDADKCGGRPCIRGLRIRVTDILAFLGAGASFEEILKDYPFLEREDILAALDYAAYQTDHAVLQSS